MAQTTSLHDQRAVRLCLHGQVQGIGLRPAVLRWAMHCCVHGWIANDSAGVHLHVEGVSADVDRFLQHLSERLPCEATLTRLVKNDADWQGYDSFAVKSSTASSRIATQVPADVVICESCLSEVLHQQHNRRHGFLFNNCAQCGPRYSIIASMPFEREQTAMAGFTLCSSCATEFTDAQDRRSHAQTMSCPACGPNITLTNSQPCTQTWSHESAADCVTLIKEGKTLAIKGIGGYQLICDATSDTTVATLRERKGRCSKPFAVMVSDLQMAARIADISATETVLSGRAGPIVLCPVLPGSGLSAHVHPGLNSVGLMLPTTALHHFFCDALRRPLIVTSGNREGEPLVYARHAAVEQLHTIADLMLHHDRDILRPIDDSVVRMIADHSATLRLARGLAPYVLPVKVTLPLIALGGQQKVALALANGQQAILGPHLGDMDAAAAQKRFVEHYADLTQLYGATPRFLVHDQHPDYFTTRWAGQQSIETVSVQHHHAHVASAMLEHGWLAKTVLGIAFDGTGYGEDGTVWGGEILLTTVHHAQRLAHLRPFIMPGGELAIREPHRLSMAMLTQICSRAEMLKLLEQFGVLRHYQPLLPLLDVPHMHAKTSSVGRLFDGVASLVLSLFEAHYEGEPAMLLEARCDRSASGSYPLPLINHQIDWRPMLLALIGDLRRSVEPGAIAMRFHRALALVIVAIIRSYPQYPAVLTGGCFQNKILVELVRELIEDDRELGLPATIPCNDGGLAAGQLVVAAARLNGLRW